MLCIYMYMYIFKHNLISFTYLIVIKLLDHSKCKDYYEDYFVTTSIDINYAYYIYCTWFIGFNCCNFHFRTLTSIMT